MDGAPTDLMMTVRLLYNNVCGAMAMMMRATTIGASPLQRNTGLGSHFCGTSTHKSYRCDTSCSTLIPTLVQHKGALLEYTVRVHPDQYVTANQDRWQYEHYFPKTVKMEDSHLYQMNMLSRLETRFPLHLVGLQIDAHQREELFFFDLLVLDRGPTKDSDIVDDDEWRIVTDSTKSNVMVKKKHEKLLANN